MYMYIDTLLLRLHSNVKVCTQVESNRLQEHLNFTFVLFLCVVRVYQSSVFGDHCLSFFVLYFGHCIVCRSNYDL